MHADTPGLPSSLFGFRTAAAWRPNACAGETSLFAEKESAALPLPLAARVARRSARGPSDGPVSINGIKVERWVTDYSGTNGDGSRARSSIAGRTGEPNLTVLWRFGRPVSPADASGMEGRMDAIRLKQILGEPLTEQELMCLQIEQNGFGCHACPNEPPRSLDDGSSIG
jgi:hypothetical protein